MLSEHGAASVRQAVQRLMPKCLKLIASPHPLPPPLPALEDFDCSGALWVLLMFFVPGVLLVL